MSLVAHLPACTVDPHTLRSEYAIHEFATVGTPGERQRDYNIPQVALGFISGCLAIRLVQIVRWRQLVDNLSGEFQRYSEFLANTNPTKTKQNVRSLIKN